MAHNALNTFSMILIALGAIFGLVALAYVLRLAFSRQSSEIGGWEFRGAGRIIIAIAKTAVAEGIRAKVASGFALIVLASLPFFWLVAEGDGTIKGRIQMFMAYSLGFSSIILALLTIFFSCRSLSHEITSRQIYGIISKPVPRWQILAGKWLGIMSLNVALVAIVGVGTYAGTMVLLGQFTRELEHELATFGGLTPEQASNTVAALKDVRGIGKDGMESPIIDAMERSTGMSRRQIGDILLMLPEPTRVNLRSFDEIRRQLLVSRAAVKVPIPREEINKEAEARFQRMAKEGRLPEALTDRQIREQIRQNLFGRFCTVLPGEPRVWELQGPLPEKRSDFIMSIRFKIHVPADLSAIQHPVTGETLESNRLLCVWGIGDPRTASYAQLTSQEPVRTFRELEIPTNCIKKDGTIILSFRNVDPRNKEVVFDFPGALMVLYRVGSFEFNLFQTCLAILVPLVCLASLGVCASTFLSFPVGSLILVILYLISISMGFVAESLAVTEEYALQESDLMFEIRRMMVESIQVLLSLGDVYPTEQLIEGRTVNWSLTGFDESQWNIVLSQWPFALAKSAIVLMLAVVVFRRRELASIIV
ncbi:MAG: ABC transporter permease [Phycisphaerales bacterium]|nr:ABC transporter permease [Phycisphaerales bacterium]